MQQSVQGKKKKAARNPGKEVWILWVSAGSTEEAEAGGAGEEPERAGERHGVVDRGVHAEAAGEQRVGRVGAEAAAGCDEVQGMGGTELLLVRKTSMGLTVLEQMVRTQEGKLFGQVIEYLETQELQLSHRLQIGKMLITQLFQHLKFYRNSALEKGEVESTFFGYILYGNEIIKGAVMEFCYSEQDHESMLANLDFGQRVTQLVLKRLARVLKQWATQEQPDKLSPVLEATVRKHKNYFALGRIPRKRVLAKDEQSYLGICEYSVYSELVRAKQTKQLFSAPLNPELFLAPSRNTFLLLLATETLDNINQLLAAQKSFLDLHLRPAHCTHLLFHVLRNPRLLLPQKEHLITSLTLAFPFLAHLKNQAIHNWTPLAEYLRQNALARKHHHSPLNWHLIQNLIPDFDPTFNKDFNYQQINQEYYSYKAIVSHLAQIKYAQDKRKKKLLKNFNVEEKEAQKNDLKHKLDKIDFNCLSVLEIWKVLIREMFTFVELQKFKSLLQVPWIVHQQSMSLFELALLNHKKDFLEYSLDDIYEQIQSADESRVETIRRFCVAVSQKELGFQGERVKEMVVKLLPLIEKDSDYYDEAIMFGDMKEKKRRTIGECLILLGLQKELKVVEFNQGQFRQFNEFIFSKGLCYEEEGDNVYQLLNQNTLFESLGSFFPRSCRALMASEYRRTTDFDKFFKFIQQSGALFILMFDANAVLDYLDEIDLIDFNFVYEQYLKHLKAPREVQQEVTLKYIKIMNKKKLYGRVMMQFLLEKQASKKLLKYDFKSLLQLILLDADAARCFSEGFNALLADAKAQEMYPDLLPLLYFNFDFTSQYSQEALEIVLQTGIPIYLTMIRQLEKMKPQLSLLRQPIQYLEVGSNLYVESLVKDDANAQIVQNIFSFRQMAEFYLVTPKKQGTSSWYFDLPAKAIQNGAIQNFTILIKSFIPIAAENNDYQKILFAQTKRLNMFQVFYQQTAYLLPPKFSNYKINTLGQGNFESDLFNQSFQCLQQFRKEYNIKIEKIELYMGVGSYNLKSFQMILEDVSIDFREALYLMRRIWQNENLDFSERELIAVELIRNCQKGKSEGLIFKGLVHQLSYIKSEEAVREVLKLISERVEDKIELGRKTFCRKSRKANSILFELLKLFHFEHPNLELIERLADEYNFYEHYYVEQLYHYALRNKKVDLLRLLVVRIKEPLKRLVIYDRSIHPYSQSYHGQFELFLPQEEFELAMKKVNQDVAARVVRNVLGKPSKLDYCLQNYSFDNEFMNEQIGVCVEKAFRAYWKVNFGYTFKADPLSLCEDYVECIKQLIKKTERVEDQRMVGKVAFLVQDPVGVTQKFGNSAAAAGMILTKLYEYLTLCSNLPDKVRPKMAEQFREYISSLKWDGELEDMIGVLSRRVRHYDENVLSLLVEVMKVAGDGSYLGKILAKKLLFSRWQNQDLVPYWNKYVEKKSVQKRLSQDVGHSTWLVEHGFEFIVDDELLVRKGSHELVVQRMKELDFEQCQQYCAYAGQNFKLVAHFIRDYQGGVLPLFKKLDLYSTLLRKGAISQIQLLLEFLSSRDLLLDSEDWLNLLGPKGELLELLILNNEQSLFEAIFLRYLPRLQVDSQLLHLRDLFLPLASAAKFYPLLTFYNSPKVQDPLVGISLTHLMMAPKTSREKLFNFLQVNLHTQCPGLPITTLIVFYELLYEMVFYDNYALPQVIFHKQKVVKKNFVRKLQGKKTAIEKLIRLSNPQMVAILTQLIDVDPQLFLPFAANEQQCLQLLYYFTNNPTLQDYALQLPFQELYQFCKKKQVEDTKEIELAIFKNALQNNYCRIGKIALETRLQLVEENLLDLILQNRVMAILYLEKKDNTDLIKSEEAWLKALVKVKNRTEGLEDLKVLQKELYLVEIEKALEYKSRTEQEVFAMKSEELRLMVQQGVQKEFRKDLVIEIAIEDKEWKKDAGLDYVGCVLQWLKQCKVMENEIVHFVQQLKQNSQLSVADEKVKLKLYSNKVTPSYENDKINLSYKDLDPNQTLWLDEYLYQKYVKKTFQKEIQVFLDEINAEVEDEVKIHLEMDLESLDKVAVEEKVRLVQRKERLFDEIRKIQSQLQSEFRNEENIKFDAFQSLHQGQFNTVSNYTLPELYCSDNYVLQEQPNGNYCVQSVGAHKEESTFWEFYENATIVKEGIRLRLVHKARQGVDYLGLVREYARVVEERQKEGAARQVERDEVSFEKESCEGVRPYQVSVVREKFRILEQKILNAKIPLQTTLLSWKVDIASALGVWLARGDWRYLVESLFENHSLHVIVRAALNQIFQLPKQVLVAFSGVQVQFREVRRDELSDMQREVAAIPINIDLDFKVVGVAYKLLKRVMVLQFAVAFKDEQGWPVGDQNEKYLQYFNNLYVPLNNLLNMRQIIALYFNQNACEQKLVEASQAISKNYFKMLSIQFSHLHLIQLFHSLIANDVQAHDFYQKLVQFRKVVLCLQRLNDTFTTPHITTYVNTLLDQSKKKEHFSILTDLIIKALHSQETLPDLLQANDSAYQITLTNQDKLIRSAQEIEQFQELTKQIHSKAVVHAEMKNSFGFQINLNFLQSMQSCGQIYIVGAYKDKTRSVKLVQVASTIRQGKFVHLDLAKTPYVTGETLLQRQQRTYESFKGKNRVQIDAVEKFGYKVLELHELRFAILVSRNWPKNLGAIEKLCFLDDELRVYLEKGDSLLELCKQLAEQQSNEETTARISLNGQAFDDVSLYNLIQVLPNNIIYDFELGSEKEEARSGKVLNTQMSKNMSMYRQQSQIQSEIMGQRDSTVIRVVIDPKTYQFKLQNEHGLQASMCNYVEHSSKFSSALTRAIGAIKDLFRNVFKQKATLLPASFARDAIQLEFSYDPELPPSKEGYVVQQLSELLGILRDFFGLLFKEQFAVRNFVGSARNLHVTRDPRLTDEADFASHLLLDFLHRHLRSIQLNVLDADKSALNLHYRDNALTFDLEVGEQMHLNFDDIALYEFFTAHVLIPLHLRALRSPLFQVQLANLQPVYNPGQVAQIMLSTVILQQVEHLVLASRCHINTLVLSYTYLSNTQLTLEAGTLHVEVLNCKSRYKLIQAFCKDEVKPLFASQPTLVFKSTQVYLHFQEDVTGQVVLINQDNNLIATDLQKQSNVTIDSSSICNKTVNYLKAITYPNYDEQYLVVLNEGLSQDSIDELEWPKMKNKQAWLLLSDANMENIYNQTKIQIFEQDQQSTTTLKKVGKQKDLLMYSRCVTNSDVILVVSARKNVKINVVGVETLDFVEDDAFDLSKTKSLKSSVERECKDEDVQRQMEEMNRKKVKPMRKEKDERANVFFKYLKTQRIESLNLEEVAVEEDAEKVVATQNNEVLPTIPSNQKGICTQAGQRRYEKVVFHNAQDKPIEVEVGQVRVQFVNQRNPGIQCAGKTEEYRDLVLVVSWEPTIKGVYDMYINGRRVERLYNGLYVLADRPCARHSRLEVGSDETISYFQRLGVEMVLRDQFNNIVSEDDYRLSDMDRKALLEISTEEDLEQLGIKQEVVSNDISTYGLLTNQVYFTTALKVDDQNKETVLNLRFRFLDHLHTKAQIVKGLSFDQRKEQFYKHVQTHVLAGGSTFQLRPNRYRFLESLLEFDKHNPKHKFQVKFQGEEGIDAGGLTREFYNLVGTCFQDPNTEMFQPTDKNLIFFHPAIASPDKVAKYIRVLATILANSIVHRHLIGVDFARCFWKVLFQIPIVFTDLKDILENDVYERYLNLQKLTDEELDFVELQFTAGDTELIENGYQTKVTKENLDLYLNLTARYFIQSKYEPYYKAFAEGFNKVLPLQDFAALIQPAEVIAFTLGHKEFNAETILKCLKCEGSSTHSQWFKQFIQSTDVEILKGFVQFATGQSSIPYDTQNFTLVAQFRPHLKITHLPIAHTCFKSIEVPCYKSYDVLAIKMRAAFLYGASGFGFA